MVFIDSEYKLSALLPDVSPRHIVTSHTGFGGNWTRGFFTCDVTDGYKKGTGNKPLQERSPPPSKPAKPSWNSSLEPSSKVTNAAASSLLSRSLTAIRTLANDSPPTAPFFVPHSLTGGTGSGFTSRLLADLKDQHPKRCIYTYSVTPFTNANNFVTDSCGPVWSYNALLALSYIDAYADCSVLRYNADLMREAQAIRGGTPGPSSASVNMTDVNQRIVCDFKSLLHPGFDLDRLRTDVMSPYNKYVSLVSSNPVPARIQSVQEGIEGQAKFCSTNVSRLDVEGRVVRTQGASVICRGYDETMLTEDVKRSVYKILGRGMAWDHGGLVEEGSVPALDETVVNFAPVKGGKRELTVAGLRSDTASFVRNVITRANGLYEVGAYLRYFEELEGDDWKEAFERCWGIVDRVEGGFDL
jgi:hypothetical protein